MTIDFLFTGYFVFSKYQQLKILISLDFWKLTTNKKYIVSTQLEKLYGVRYNVFYRILFKHLVWGKKIFPIHQSILFKQFRIKRVFFHGCGNHSSGLRHAYVMPTSFWSASEHTRRQSRNKQLVFEHSLCTMCETSFSLGLQERMQRLQELTDFTESCQAELKGLFEALGWSQELDSQAVQVETHTIMRMAYLAVNECVVL